MKLLSTVFATGLLIVACQKKDGGGDGGAKAPEPTKVPEVKPAIFSDWNAFEASISNECQSESDLSNKEAVKAFCTCASKEERTLLEARYGDVKNLPAKIELSDEEGEKIADKCVKELGNTP